MKLTDLDNKKTSVASKALKENYNFAFDASKMDMPKTQTMLKKVRGLIGEAKSSPDFYSKQTEPTYMKLVFMEQALTQHYVELKRKPIPRIVIENEEVEKSQVVLAAQDLVDSVQKMLEEVSDMLVKELPALVNSVQSEIGVNESETFNQQATEALTSLQSALTQSKTGLQGALNGITGQGGAEAFDAGTEAPVPGEETAVMGMEEPLPGGGEEEIGAEITEPEAPEELPVPGAGRAKR